MHKEDLLSNSLQGLIYRKTSTKPNHFELKFRHQMQFILGL